MASDPANSIDKYIQEKLAAANLKPSPEAAKATLLRRVTMDLTGLIPTRQELQDFLADTRPGAYERVVDRLLASPHYGEQQARHWLDLARYSTPTATRLMRREKFGSIAIGSSTPTTRTCPSINSRSSKSREIFSQGFAVTIDCHRLSPQHAFELRRRYRF